MFNINTSSSNYLYGVQVHTLGSEYHSLVSRLNVKNLMLHREKLDGCTIHGNTAHNPGSDIARTVVHQVTLLGTARCQVFVEEYE